MESRISGHTKLYCLIGSPVGHSGSPAMYNYSFERTGIDAAYLAFNIPLEETEKAVQALKTLGVGGFNVTMPDKTAVASYLDALSPAAKLIGACNTVTVGEDGKLTGHNTDGMGFVRNIHEHGIEVKGKRLVVLGAGGAATAICVQAALDGAAEIAIFNRGQGDFFPNGQRTVEKLRQAVPACRASITPLEDKDALARAVADCDIDVSAGDEYQIWINSTDTVMCYPSVLDTSLGENEYFSTEGSEYRWNNSKIKYLGYITIEV